MQLQSIWKRLLVHNDLRSISSGNCVPLDTCRILSISSNIERDHKELDVASVSMLRSDRDVEIRLPDHDYSTLEHHVNLSAFIENVVVYIAGFVVRAVSQKLVCNVCKSVLVSETNSDLYSLQTDHALLEKKNRGGLITPSLDVITICKASEVIFRRNMGPGKKPPSSMNIDNILVLQSLAELVGMDVFSNLLDHDLESEILNNHRFLLMKQVSSQYLLIRLYHQGKEFTRSLQGENVRSILSKTVLFKGQ